RSQGSRTVALLLSRCLFGYGLPDVPPERLEERGQALPRDSRDGESAPGVGRIDGRRCLARCEQIGLREDEAVRFRRKLARVGSQLLAQYVVLRLRILGIDGYQEGEGA